MRNISFVFTQLSFLFFAYKEFNSENDIDVCFVLGLYVVFVVYIWALANSMNTWMNQRNPSRKNRSYRKKKSNKIVACVFRIDMFSSILLAIVIYYYKNIIIFVSFAALHVHFVFFCVFFFNCFSLLCCWYCICFCLFL